MPAEDATEKVYVWVFWGATSFNSICIIQGELYMGLYNMSIASLHPIAIMDRFRGMHTSLLDGSIVWCRRKLSKAGGVQLLWGASLCKQICWILIPNSLPIPDLAQGDILVVAFIDVAFDSKEYNFYAVYVSLLRNGIVHYTPDDSLIF